MEIKKRILSAAILLTVLGAGTAYVYQHPYYPEDVAYEETDYSKKTKEDLIEENELEADPYLAYNAIMTKKGVNLDEGDMIYLSSLREDQNMVAVSNSIGHYTTVSLDNSDDYLMVMEDGKDVRLTEKDPIGDYYYDILAGIYASEGMYGVDPKDVISFGEFVDMYDLVPAGICLPNLGKCEASDYALAIIEELYGKKLAEIIKEKGLPLPYYSYADIYHAYEKEKDAVKGLNN